MRTGSPIGARIEQEQELTSEAMQWIVCIAAAIIRAFGEGATQMIELWEFLAQAISLRREDLDAPLIPCPLPQVA